MKRTTQIIVKHVKARGELIAKPPYLATAKTVLKKNIARSAANTLRQIPVYALNAVGTVMIKTGDYP
jgi:hypothetical protein